MTLRVTVEVDVLRHRRDSRWSPRTVRGTATTERGLGEVLRRLVLVPGSAGTRKVVRITVRGSAEALNVIAVDRCLSWYRVEHYETKTVQEGIPIRCGTCQDCDSPPGIGGASFCYANGAPREPLAGQPYEVDRKAPPPQWCPLRPKPAIEVKPDPVRGDRWRNRKGRDVVVLGRSEHPKPGSVVWRYTEGKSRRPAQIHTDRESFLAAHDWIENVSKRLDTGKPPPNPARKLRR